MNNGVSESQIGRFLKGAYWVGIFEWALAVVVAVVGCLIAAN